MREDSHDYFFFNDTATTEIYPLSLPDALPISILSAQKYCEWLSGQTKRTFRLPTEAEWQYAATAGGRASPPKDEKELARSEEHTSELQSRQYLVCRLLLEKKKHTSIHNYQVRH